MKVRKLKLEKANLSKKEKKTVKKHRQEIKDILSGKDNRFLIIIGPCSAWPEKAVLDYAKKLRTLQNELGNLKLVLRVYTQKPRTNLGWKGLAMQPDPCKAENIKQGVKRAQNLMRKLIELNLALADEALFLPITHYYEDFLSYLALGARSSEDQEHRSYGATRDFAVCVKNPSSGDEQVAINSLLATRAPASFYLEGELKSSDGNKASHLVLRGGKKPNYKEKDILKHIDLAEKSSIQDLSVIIDTNHANSQKNYLKQIDIARYIAHLRKKNTKIKNAVKGLMIESFLKDGSQKINCQNLDLGGLSITDPSLGWDKTEELLRFLNS